MSDKNKITRPPDEEIQRLVIDTIMKQWPAKQSLVYINHYMKNEGKKEIKLRRFQRIKLYMKEHQFDRLFEIARDGFVSQHLDRIDDLISIKKEMWECYYAQKKVDPYKATQILSLLTQVQPYLSQYYEASKYIMQAVNRAIYKDKYSNDGTTDYIPTARTKSDHLSIHKS